MVRALSSLRARLAIAILLVTTVALAATFLVVYHGTARELRDGIDADLTVQRREWRNFVAWGSTHTTRGLERTARRFLHNQRYHPHSQIIVIEIVGRPSVTNRPHLLDGEQRAVRRGGDAASLLRTRPGLADATLRGVGRVRTWTEPVTIGGRRIGTFRVANPLASVEQAQRGLRTTFAAVASLTALAAILVSALVATVLARPLRRLAGIAASLDAGDLDRRTGMGRHAGETGLLARSLDGMLDRLERAFTRERRFVADTSHELRTPLAVLRAQVELLQREHDEAAREQGLSTLLARLDGMDRLVADILTLAGARGLIRPQEVALEPYFDDLRRDLPLFGERDYRVEPAAGTLRVDPDRLDQVLRNLVRNAVNHTAVGDEIAVRAEPRPGGVLRISVCDSGPGIPVDELEPIFDRFHRVSGARGADRGGSGLGLPIARALVEAHGGRIWAQSPPGEGATIVLELPGHEPAPAAAPAVGSSA